MQKDNMASLQTMIVWYNTRDKNFIIEKTNSGVPDHPYDPVKTQVIAAYQERGSDHVSMNTDLLFKKMRSKKRWDKFFLILQKALDWQPDKVV